MLTAVWENAVIDDRKVQGYHLALSPFPAELVMQAAAKHMQTSRFFPLPADLISLMAEQVPQLSAGEAWEEVQQVIRRRGYIGGRVHQFQDPAIAQAVRQVGWSRLCLDDNEKGYVRRDFDLAYQAATERRVREISTGQAGPMVSGGPTLGQLYGGEQKPES